MGLGKLFTKKCAQSHVSSLWRLTWVFDGTWKNIHEKVCPVTRFFAVETILSFWGDVESFDKKVWPVTHFFSLWRLTWVFDGTWKTFHKKVCPVTRFFAVETILSFWWDLESFDKKVWPVTRFSFALETNLSFWWDLENFSQKSVPSYTFCSLWRLTWVFDGTWKVSTKRCDQLHIFFALETNLSFWWALENFSQKSVPSYTFCSLWRLTWVFDGPWKNFHKKVCPVICFFAVETNLSFWWDLEKHSQKKCAQSHVSSLWRLS